MEETPIANSDSKASSTSTSPISKPLELESIVPTHQAESITVERKMKRPRDTGPTTPRGEGDEFKILGGGLTPLAKKGRVQPDANGAKPDNSDDASDTSSVGGEDDNEIGGEPSSSSRVIVSTPPHVPAPGLETISAPPTPILASNTLGPIKREGLETMKIRHRVQALEWEDDGITPQLDMEDEDTVIIDRVEDETEVNGLAAGQEEKDIELKDVTAENVEEVMEPKDVEITDLTKEKTTVEVDEAVALEEVEKQDKEMVSSAPVSEEKKTVEEKDVEFAEVAAEVGTTAIEIHGQDDKKEAEYMETAEVAAEVGASAKLIAVEDEKDQEIAEVAAEVAEVAAIVPEEKKADVPAGEKELPILPVAPSTPMKNSFSAFSSTASPFSAFNSSTSPFGSVAPAPPPAQKPKTKSTFGAPSLNLETPSAPISITESSSSSTASTLSSSLPASFGTPKPLSSTTQPPPLAPSTPFSKFSSSSSAVASTSGNHKSLSSTASVSALPFSAFSSSSGFASASTISSSSSGFGSYSAASASPFASIQSQISSTSKEDNVGSSSRKLGEPEEVDAGKRIFTEQESFTGEEGDNTIHTVRCKLFVMSAGAWVERGTGILRLNLTRDSDSDKSGARLVMRADATHRLLLNATLFPAFSIEVSQEKYVRFAVIEESEPMSYMLRMAGTPAAQSLVDVVKGRVADL